MKHRNVDELLIAGAVSNLFYSMAYPIVHTITMQDINSNIMSFASLVNCIIAMLITRIWLDRSKYLYKTFGTMLVLEGIAYGLLTGAYLTGIATAGMYYVGDAILNALITRNVICGGTRLKALRYKGEEREKFDNKTNYYCYLTSIIGFAFSWKITLPTSIGFIFMFIGIAVDNIFYLRVYKKENLKKVVEM